MKRDDCFLVFDSHGDIGASPSRPDGLFNCDTLPLAFRVADQRTPAPPPGVEPLRRQLRPQCGPHKSGHLLRQAYPAAEEARLSPQPDDAVPRFDYENHVHALVTDRVWPESTRQISELRLVIEYQSRTGAMRQLILDIVDYPFRLGAVAAHRRQEPSGAAARRRERCASNRSR